MINIADVRIAYQHLYQQLRKFLWPFEVVTKIADLEVEVFTAFPNADNLKKRMTELEVSVRDVCKSDEELKNAVDELSDVIYACTAGIYNKLKSFHEV